MSNSRHTADSASVSDGEWDDYEMPPDNGLKVVGSPRRLENIYDYDQGGHYPVHLGDVLHRRYKVLHKLGSGGFANVWLCSDISVGQPRYVALKIMMAEASTSNCPELRVSEIIARHGLTDGLFCIPLERFEIEGPNGVHYVFVYPVLGPDVADIPRRDPDDAKVPYRELCFQAAQAMAVLHEHGICHGDFRPVNILTHLSGLDNLSEDSLLGLISSPGTTRVITREGETHSLNSAPQYLVYPLDWCEMAESSKAGAEMITYKLCITDFGESYQTISPPSDLGIPMAYCAPEYDLDKRIGVTNDVWALGCTLFEILTGEKLFSMFEAELDEHLFQITTILGRMPEPWWSETWTGRKRLFEDGVDEKGRAMGRSNVDMDGRPRSLWEVIVANKPPEDGISDSEAERFADLVSKLLRYRPEERISPREALDHDWFKFRG